MKTRVLFVCLGNICRSPTAEVVFRAAAARAGLAARVEIDSAGIGSTMAANKVAGVRCALCHDDTTVLNSREHNDANVLVLPARCISEDQGVEILRRWLNTPFAGGRHSRRVAKIEEGEGT